MDYIKKNVNIILLFLVIVVLMSIGGISSYYQYNYRNITERYQEKVNTLNELKSALEEHKAELNKTLEEFRLKQLREQELSQDYSKLKSEKEHVEQVLNETNTTLIRTENELADTIQDLNKKSLELESTKLELANAKTEITNKNIEIAQLNTRVSNLQSEISDLDDRIDELEDDLYACRHPTS